MTAHQNYSQAKGRRGETILASPFFGTTKPSQAKPAALAFRLQAACFPQVFLFFEGEGLYEGAKPSLACHADPKPSQV